MRVSYIVECDYCSTTSKVIISGSEVEPENCPMCGTEAYVVVIGEEDSDR